MGCSEVTVTINRYNGSGSTRVHRFDNPIVLVTRPREDAERFVEALRSKAGPFRALICPAFETVGVDHELPDFDQAIFTSQAGANFAPLGLGRKAYCVGRATARAAQAMGYEPVDANGNADTLVDLILKQKPTESLLHIRGEVSHGNVIARLQSVGFDCAEVIVYRKATTLPNTEVYSVLQQSRPCIVPLFSAETGSILALWDTNWRASEIVAISATVAQSADGLNAQKTHVCSAPTMDAMVAATARLIA